MTLRVEEHAGLGAIGRAAWLALEAVSPGATVFQSWWWLNAWWQTWGTGRPLVLAVRDEGRLVGLGAFYIDDHRRLGFIGEEHADYGNVLAEDDRADVIEALVLGILARRDRWRRVDLRDVRTDTGLSAALQAAGFDRGEPVPCPRVRFARRSLEDLLAKDSLRRHERRLKERGALEFLHLDSRDEIEPWLAAFFEQHLERWSLTATPSLFLEPRNREFYSELASTAEPGGSLLFTVVLAGGQAVAMHFGLRSQDDLVWYKPTFDPRLAASGPGEVLLAELLRRAAREHCGGLDFTRGDESFKLRFASEVREVASFEAFASRTARRRARLGRRLRAGIVAGLVRAGLKRPVAHLSSRSLRAARLWRAEGAGAVLARARAAFSEPRSARIAVHSRPTAPAGAAPELPAGFAALYCGSVDALLEVADPAEPEHAALLSVCARRFAGRDELVVGLAGGRLVAWGWLTRASPLPVTEVGAWLHFPPSTVLLYDFQVVARERGRGYYAALLKAIAGDGGGTDQVVYARADNAASLAGMRAAGFRFLGTIERGRGAPVFRVRGPGPVLRVRPGDADDGTGEDAGG